jgi:hypothetical protein
VVAAGSLAARRARQQPSALLAVATSALLLSGCAVDYVPKDSIQPARVRIPRPARALLAPPKEPACTPPVPGDRAQGEKPDAAKGAAGSTAPAQPHEPGSAQGPPEGSLAQRVRLEFERNCFREAEMRMRARLLQLQAAVGRTIRSMERMQARETAARQ